MDPSFTTTWIPTRLADTAPPFDRGIMCRWQADPTVGTDNVLTYGWTEATRADWERLIAATKAVRPDVFIEQGPRGEYLTSQEIFVADENGYGATYLFTGDAIIYAMTKAETDDVAGPPLVGG